MCGIAGIISNNKQIETMRLTHLQESLVHRGPDDYGMWMNADQTVGFVHTRLSIIDLTQSGHQPMQTPDGRYTIVFNGEIYNFASLKKELGKHGENFISTSDTEVLLKLWAKEGVLAIERIRGMFAFAIWDSLKSKLTLARDPLGIKPLYFSQHSNGLAFASESGALKAVGFGGEINPRAIGAFLLCGSVPAPLGLYKGIESLMPGEWLQWEQNTGKVTRKVYWSYAKQIENNMHNLVTDYREAVSLTRKALIDSVKAHLVSDVPVGAFLSGGIDSTAAVSLMCQAGQENIATFSIIFDDKELDESYYSRIAAQTYNTEHHEWRVSKSEFFDLKDEFIKSMDSPTIDGINTWMVARFARQHGFKVVTSGVGGDEFFYGYDGTFRQLPVLMKHLGAVPSVIKKAALKTMDFPFVKNTIPRKINKAASLLEASPDLSMGYLAYRGLFSKQDIKELISDKDLAYEAASVDMADFLPSLPENAEKEQKVSVLEASCYLASQLLPDSDRFSMAHALELRVPLVDRMVAENLSRIAPKLFYDQKRTPKALLVNAVADIPDEIIYRKKQGFTLPIGRWIKNEEWEPKSRFLNKDACKKINNAFRSSKMHWSRQWTLEVLDNFKGGLF
ncbi:MAG: asparagine synthase (glutamine-hydrolyzing) [Candidatus Marinimicrobia bacterium]|nr:asparagine synthase (glutamine-hydrolyzing) [Candidatus Neomarinimicrobiota bacterium]